MVLALEPRIKFSFNKNPNLNCSFKKAYWKEKLYKNLLDTQPLLFSLSSILQLARILILLANFSKYCVNSSLTVLSFLPHLISLPALFTSTQQDSVLSLDKETDFPSCIFSHIAISPVDLPLINKYIQVKQMRTTSVTESNILCMSISQK